MLDRVTITGADDFTDPLELLDLALSYPWLEFGILASKSREGSPRYPSRDWQKKLLKISHRMNLSIHVCGKYAREMFAGELRWELLPPIRDGARRVQINGETPGDRHLSAAGLALELEGRGLSVIFQYPRAVEYMAACREHGLNSAPLFDESGGEGRQVRAWSDMSECEYVGYAGGIGPEDAAETVGTIMAFRQGPFWIDMEGRVRSDKRDELDMWKVRRVLEICDGIIHKPGFDGLMEAAERKVTKA